MTISSQFIFEVCPCDLECPAGCEGCSNSICEDPNSSTTVSTITTGVSSEKAVLMLNTARSENVPMVITFNGDVDDKINFTYDERTELRSPKFVSLVVSHLMGSFGSLVEHSTDNRLASFES